MRELNTIKIIAVDHGYGNIKTANTVTPTGVTAYETEPIFSGNILEYAGIYYRIGEGHKEFIADKAMDEDYYILTLMAVARELNVYGIREADVHLAAGLPLTGFANREKISETICSVIRMWISASTAKTTISVLLDAVCSRRDTLLLSAVWEISKEPIFWQTSETVP